DPLPYLEMMTRMTGPTGLIPEQVWDGPPLRERGMQPGKPTGGVIPLFWAHAELLKLLRARRENRPIELLNSLEEHLRRKTATVGTWHWRTDTPFDAPPANRDLLVEMESPFVLHVGFDGWKAVEDRSSAALPFGRHGVRLGKDELAGNRVLDFTRYFSRDSKWEGNDYLMWLTPEQERLDVRGRPRATLIFAPPRGRISHCVAGQVSGVVVAHLGLLLSSEGGLDRPRAGGSARKFCEGCHEPPSFTKRALGAGIGTGSVAMPAIGQSIPLKCSSSGGLRLGRSLMHGVAPQMCGQVASPLLGCLDMSVQRQFQTWNWRRFN